MNIDVVIPGNRLQLPHGSTATIVTSHLSDIYIGSSNGSLSVVRTTKLENTIELEGGSIRSYKSFSEVKQLFNRNNDHHSLTIDTTFRNTTGDNRPIDKIACTQLESKGPIYVFISKSDSIRLFERVESKLNLIEELKDVRLCLDLNIFTPSTGSTHVILAIKKKLLVYTLTKRSNNKVHLQFLKEILLKEKVKRLIIPNSQDHVLIELTSDYKLLSKNLQVSSLPVNETDLQNFALASSFSYFNLSNSGPLTFALLLQDSLYLLIKELQAAILDIKNKTFEPSKIKLSSIPISAAYLPPSYVSLVYPKKMEVVETHTGDVVQVYNHQVNSNAILTNYVNGMLTFVTGFDVLSFLTTDQESQIKQYLKLARSSTPAHKLDPKADPRLVSLLRAIQLLSTRVENDSTKSQFTKHTLLRIRELYCMRAKILFQLYNRYHESLVEIGSEWILDYQDALNMFPNFLNGSDSKFIEDHENNDENGLRSISVQDLSRQKEIGSQTGESGTENEGLQGESARLTESPMIKRFTKAVNNLIIYLTDQRRIILTFMNDSNARIEWKGVKLAPEDLFPSNESKHLEKVAASVDTSLFLCYFYLKPMLLGPLLRLPNNFCDSQVVKDCLLSGVHEHGTGPVFIKELLDFYYTRGLHKEALNMLFDLAHTEISDHDDQFDEFLSGPSLTIQYLQKLDNTELALILEFSCWVLRDYPDDTLENGKLIFMNETFECEGYNNMEVLAFLSEESGIFEHNLLAIRYAEWLLNETDILENKPDKDLLRGKFQTKLCLLYLDVLYEEFDSEVYDKLFNFLLQSTLFEPWTILKHIKSNDDRFLRLTVFVYRLLGEHDKAVDVLFGQLNDFEGAMTYATNIYLGDAPKSSQSAGIKVEIGRRLIFKLLEDLLMDYNNNMDKIQRLLDLHGSEISILQILTSLPSLFPLKRLSKFLTQSLLTSKRSSQNTDLQAQLNKVGMIKLQHELVTTECTSYKIDSGRQPCALCHKKLGYGVFALDDKDQVVHYSCLQNSV